MASTACCGVAAGRVLPCGLHCAPAGRAAGAAEPAGGLWHSLPCGSRNLVANRRRPQAPRRPDRLFGGAAYLGTKPSSSSASPLRRSWRRDRVRPAPLDFVPPAVSLSGQGAQPSVPRQIRRLSESRFPRGRTRLSRRTKVPGREEDILRVANPGGRDRMGSLCQTAVRRTPTGAEIPGSLYPSGSYFEPASDLTGGRPRDFSLEELCSRK